MNPSFLRRFVCFEDSIIGENIILILPFVFLHPFGGSW